MRIPRRWISRAVIDLFSGVGGWDVAAEQLGVYPLGIEIDEDACATRRAAGLRTLCTDVLSLDPYQFAGCQGLIASPPCQTFSMAGSGTGREALDEVLALIPEIVAGRAISADHLDVRTLLVLQPLRWALAIRPRWIALEQVPPVLPVWQAYAEVLREHGYSVAVGCLNSEQYGVPQTRKRAILAASREFDVELPTPTHSKFYSRDPERLDDGVKPWISMAEALGWGMTERPSVTLSAGGTDTGGAEPFGNGGRQGMERERSRGSWVMRSNYGTNGDPARRGEREEDQPAPAITSKIDRNMWRLRNNTNVNASTRSIDQPAGTLFFGDRLNDVSWVVSTGVHSRRRWDLNAPWRDTHALQERAISSPSPTVDCKAGGAWKVHPMGQRPSPTITTSRRSDKGGLVGHQLPAGTGRNVGGRDWVQTSGTRPNAVMRNLEQPSVALAFGNDVASYRFIPAEAVDGWPNERPSTPVAGDSRIPAPGHKCRDKNCHPDREPESQMKNAIRVSIEEAAALQSFPHDFPWQGTKTSRFKQVGNAIPTLLALSVLECVVCPPMSSQ